MLLTCTVSITPSITSVTPWLCHNGLKVNAQCPDILVLGAPCKSIVVTIKADVYMLFVVLTIIVTWLLGDSTFFPTNGLAYVTSPFVDCCVSLAAVNDHKLESMWLSMEITYTNSRSVATLLL